MPISLTPANQLQTAKCTLGCPTLDALLQGGIPCGSLTEIVGNYCCSSLTCLPWWLAHCTAVDRDYTTPISLASSRLPVWSGTRSITRTELSTQA